VPGLEFIPPLFIPAPDEKETLIAFTSPNPIKFSVSFLQWDLKNSCIGTSKGVLNYRADS